ncbi:MAG: hypothetical protein K6T81_13385 [Alicyclobacillus macrosporangiidus]|nr:hypothetical protein [Alicyclobacillus macrosporangiidus]
MNTARGLPWAGSATPIDIRPACGGRILCVQRLQHVVHMVYVEPSGMWNV